ncbi:hypothetical protein BRADI_3g19545v3, partial [Brachypodium distachyon]
GSDELTLGAVGSDAGSGGAPRLGAVGPEEIGAAKRGHAGGGGEGSRRGWGRAAGGRELAQGKSAGGGGERGGAGKGAGGGGDGSGWGRCFSTLLFGEEKERGDAAKGGKVISAKREGSRTSESGGATKGVGLGIRFKFSGF